MRRPAVSKQNFFFGGKRICPYTDGTIMQIERKSEQCTKVILSHVVLISISLWFNSIYETQLINVYMFHVVHILERSTHAKSSESSMKSKTVCEYIPSPHRNFLRSPVKEMKNVRCLNI